MSYYYNYFIGYQKGKKIYPLGPYNALGEMKAVICRSASYASDLHERFSSVGEGQISEELRKQFEFTDYRGINCVQVRYLAEKDLPEGSYIRRGYYLIDDVAKYEADDGNGDFDGFYHSLTPQIYAAKLEKEIQFGKNMPQKDAEGNDYSEPNASDYMFYAYPEYQSEEYEASVLRFAASVLKSYSMDDDIEIVILETEG